MDCNADLGHPCDANDGGPCDACAEYAKEMLREYEREKHWAKPANYRQDMIDGGRGHLLRDDD